MKYSGFLIVFLVFSCIHREQDLAGLWQLEYVNIDGLEKPFSPMLLDIKEENNFALSKVSGDLVGTYRQTSNTLEWISEDQQWFNTRWNYRHYEEKTLDLYAPDKGLKNTKIRFRKIDEVPGFQVFANRLVGTWELYKIRERGQTTRVQNTFLVIDSLNYTIYNDAGVLESGRTLIDSRHRKIVFENGDLTWNIWFYGQEPRLDNKRLGIQYSLRQID